jgi:hypothetical protein
MTSKSLLSVIPFILCGGAPAAFAADLDYGYQGRYVEQGPPTIVERRIVELPQIIERRVIVERPVEQRVIVERRYLPAPPPDEVIEQRVYARHPLPPRPIGPLYDGPQVVRSGGYVEPQSVYPDDED